MSENNETLMLPPFPPLTWGGWDWRCPWSPPWCRTEETPELIVRPVTARSLKQFDARSAPQPAAEQVAAFQFLLDPETPLQHSLLLQIRENVPELADAGWPEVQSYWELATVMIFRPAHEDVAYTGFVFNCLQWDDGYEHGLGIVAHKERVVFLGMGEDGTNEAKAQSDLRRIARLRNRTPEI